MARARPASYAWLSDESFPIAVAGCITVVPGSDRPGVAGSFGGKLGAAVPPSPIGDFARFESGRAAVIAVEDNGSQGTRAAVLTVASRVSTNGRVASLYWNVEGDIIVTCAADGKLITSFDLDPDVIPGDLPRPLRRLATLCKDESDLLALGAAMVEAYTGTGFTAADLAEEGSWYRLLPPSDELPVVTIQSASLNLWNLSGREADTSRLLRMVAALDPIRQRRLAEWLATVTFEQAALPSNVPYAKVIASFGGEQPPTLSTNLLTYMQRVERVWTAAHTSLAVNADQWFPQLSLDWLGQIHMMGLALRYACHADAPTAAFETLSYAGRSLALAERLGSGKVSANLPAAISAYCDTPDMRLDAFRDALPRPVARSVREGLLGEEQAIYEIERSQWDAIWKGLGESTGPIKPYVLPRDRSM